VAIAAIGCSITAMSLPMMFFFQLARGLTPTQAALLTVPTAVLSGVLSPLAGMLLVRVDPRVLLVPSLLLVGGGQFWYAAMMNGTTDVLMFLWPAALIGLGSAGMWGPLATTATLDLPPRQAGAASGIYNTTRTIGSVLGSAGIAALMQARLEANLGGAASGSASGLGTGQLPAAIVEPFSSAMAQSMLLSVAAMAVGLVVALFLRRSKATSSMPRRAAEPERPGV
jgi:MFS family permease